VISRLGISIPFGYLHVSAIGTGEYHSRFADSGDGGYFGLLLPVRLVSALRLCDAAKSSKTWRWLDIVFGLAVASFR
jgi:hypothetical protein